MQRSDVLFYFGIGQVKDTQMRACLQMETNDKAKLDGYERGRQMYANGEPRPKTPADDPGPVSDVDLLWFGWMMARAERVTWTMKWLAHLYEKDSMEYHKQLIATIKAMDKRSGLNPDIRDENGFSTPLDSFSTATKTLIKDLT